MIQPGLVPKLYNDEIEEQGFLGRILPIKPKSWAGESDENGLLKRQYNGEDENDPTFDHPAFVSYYSRMSELLERPPQFADSEHLELTPPVMKFDKEAVAEFTRYVNDVERRVSTELGVIESLALKAPEHAARLAAVLSLVSDDNSLIIDARSLQSGIKLIEFYMRQAARVKGTALGFSKALIDAEKLRKWIAKNRHKEIPLKLVHQSGPLEFRSARKAASGMQILKEHNWVRESGVNVWEAHPALLRD